MDKEIKIIPPEGYKIDEENSTFDCIKFRPIEKRWRDDVSARIAGYKINAISEIYQIPLKFSNANIKINYSIFAIEKQAKSALAMARISQIMANDKRVGGAVTDEEWKNPYNVKYVIIKAKGTIVKDSSLLAYYFLAFHTPEQRDLFLEENEDLVKDYLMID